MKFSVFSVLLATVLIASSNVQSFESNAVNHARRHHSKAQELQKREVFSGQATWYGWNAGDQGACGEYLQKNAFYVALNHGQYGNMNAQSSYCGKTITITNGIKTTQARILDACPGDGSTCKWGALDMSQPLFEFFNPLGVGVFQMRWWVTGSGGGDSGSSSGGGNNNNDDDSSDDSNDSDSGSNGAAAKAAAAKQAAAQKAAQEKAAKEKAQQAAAAKKKAAAAAKAKAAKEAAAKKAAAEKKAAAAAKVKAQHENIAAFGEIMQTLNQIVENAVVPNSASSSAAASSPSSASAASSSKSA